jgi:hypothetical protein
MEQNSPDMDKMWEKIQQHIDSQPQKPVQTVQENQPEPEMKRRRIGFVKYAAAAACLVAVVAGTVVFMNSKQDKVPADSEKAVVVPASSAPSAQEKEEGKDTKKELQPAQDQIGEETADKAPVKAQEKAINRSEDQASASSASASSGISTKFRELMLTPEYTNSDREGKLKAAENLAKQLKEKGEIKEYVLKKKDTGDRIELKVNEEETKVIMIR